MIIVRKMFQSCFLVYFLLFIGSVVIAGCATKPDKILHRGDTLGFLTGHMGSINSVVFSPDGTTLASGSTDKTIRLWNAVTGQHKATLGHGDKVESVVFSPDGATLASRSDTTVQLWDVATGRHKVTLAEHTGLILSIAFGPDGTTLASGKY